MRQVQILIWNVAEPWLETLRNLAQDRGVWLREVRHQETCLNLIRQAKGGVLVLSLGKNLDEELSTLAQIGQLFPEFPVIVLGDTLHPTLASLIWDLGARYVLFPPQTMEALPELVAAYLPEQPSTPTSE